MKLEQENPKQPLLFSFQCIKGDYQVYEGGDDRLKKIISKVFCLLFEHHTAQYANAQATSYTLNKLAKKNILFHAIHKIYDMMLIRDCQEINQSWS